MTWLIRLTVAALLLFGGAWALYPPEGLGTAPDFDASAIGDDPAEYLAAQEARFDDIVPGTEKRIVWAGAPGEDTDWVVIYLHGFSASSEEIRPVPDRVAEALGANLVFMRLTGHGRDGPAMAQPVAADWVRDLDEALAVADRIGDRVLAISTSTGGTLAAYGAATGRGIDAQIMISPNFGIQNSAAFLLRWPAAEHLVPLLAGETRSFEPENDAHARYWTTRYPTVSTLPMAALVAAANDADLGQATAPALVLLSENDEVVRPAATRDAMGRWGGPVTIETVDVPPGNAPSHHVLAGDILSPGLTDPMAARMVDWVRALP
ncbi:alpha/beta hydrolase [Palleronia pelagia]|uniref:Lysophospholipase, alpha-beta hydrolase superfamily n=1 Tax=Palleronia pelagia TaxID=387096 RepID=A0A1H8GRR3_9RHOB|nr:alpha/beta fold hydrolase [Palleronia pelagia]SEN46404.1 Lysophospholipase, alpha-beta hydrolase superfamily [Palleronia pelagia]